MFYPMHEVAVRIVKAKKIVFTKTLVESQWENTEVATGTLVHEVNKLKNQSGKDIIVYGGSSFVANLIKERLIDEFYLFVNPVVLGRGVSVFSLLEEYRQMKLKDATMYPSGIVLLTYKPSDE